jgi:uncharacterized protein (TIGR03435 family)
MRLRPLLLLTLMASTTLGQTGFYGPITAHPKAGDPAPDITFATMLNAPGAASWSQSNLFGKITVLAFFPNTSQNLQPVTLWNALVEKFSAKPVQFLWITGEKETTLLPWLLQHPVKGWVFYDPSGKTGQAYGLELPATVIIGTDGKIMGFDRSPLPDESLLNAALEDRITTISPDRTTIQAFLKSNQMVLDPEPPRMPRPNENKPNFTPSYTLHVSPSQTEVSGNSSGDDYRSLQGITLKELMTGIYNINSIRIDLPVSVDQSKRYDFALVLPEPENRNKMDERFRQGFEEYFHLTATRENRLREVYVVTAPNRHPPEIKSQSSESINSSSGFTSFSSSFIGLEAVGSFQGVPAETKPIGIEAIVSISAEGTADEFCNILEAYVDRPVINETHLPGRYEFNVEGTPQESKNDFVERLRNQLGIVITPSQRNVEVLVLRPR